MSLVLVNIVGFLATATSFIRFVPQTVRTWRMRRDPAALRGLSVSTQWLSFANSCLWVAYGVLLGAPWVSAPSLANAPMAVLTLILIYRSRRLPTEPTFSPPKVAVI